VTRSNLSDTVFSAGFICFLCNILVSCVLAHCILSCSALFLKIFMVARRNRADHYIFILWFLLSFFLLFFPRLISAPSAVADWMSTILPHMLWPSVNLECRSEMWCVRLAGNARPKKITIWARIDNRKKTCETAIPPPHVSTIW